MTCGTRELTVGAAQEVTQPRGPQVMRQRSFGRKVEHTVEDAEGLLNSLLLLTVLMLAFAVAQLTATFTLEDLLAADQRDVTMKWNRNGRPEYFELVYGCLSHHFIITGMQSVLWLVLALVLGVASYISLCYSDARESPEFLKLWWKVHRWVMAAGWLSFLVGSSFFLRGMHSSLDIISPRYASFKIVNGTLSEPALQDKFTGAGPTLDAASLANETILWGTIGTVVLGIILHVVLVIFLHPDKRAPHETIEVDELELKVAEQ